LLNTGIYIAYILLLGQDHLLNFLREWRLY